MRSHDAIRPGLREVDAAALVESTIRSGGTGFEGARLVRAWAHITSGPEGTYLQSMLTPSGERAMQAGDLVMIEMAVCADGYWSDLTRVYCVGQPTAEQVRLYNAVLAAQQAGAAQLIPGKTWGDPDQAGRLILEQAGLGVYFKHGTGHGVGYRYHETIPQLGPGNTGVFREKAWSPAWNRVFTCQGSAASALKITWRSDRTDRSSSLSRASPGKHMSDAASASPINPPASKGRDFWRSAFPSGNEQKWWIAVVLVTLVGLVYRLAYLNQPAGYDETYTYLAFARQPLIHIFTDYSFPNNHIFHTLLVALTTRLIPLPAIWVMRLPALIAGLLLIPVTYLAGWKLYRAEAGLLAAGMTAASLTAINFSAEARGYTLVCLFSMLLLWLGACLIERAHWTGWIGLSLCGILGGVTIPIMLYPLAAIYTWLFVEFLLRTRRPKDFLPLFASAALTLAGVLAGYLPLIVYGTGWESLAGNSFVAPLARAEWLPTPAQ